MWPFCFHHFCFPCLVIRFLEPFFFNDGEFNFQGFFHYPKICIDEDTIRTPLSENPILIKRMKYKVIFKKDFYHKSLLTCLTCDKNKIQTPPISSFYFDPWKVMNPSYVSKIIELNFKEQQIEKDSTKQKIDVCPFCSYTFSSSISVEKKLHHILTTCQSRSLPCPFHYFNPLSTSFANFSYIVDFNCKIKINSTYYLNNSNSQHSHLFISEVAYISSLIMEYLETKCCCLVQCRKCHLKMNIIQYTYHELHNCGSINDIIFELNGWCWQ